MPERRTSVQTSHDENHIGNPTVEFHRVVAEYLISRVKGRYAEQVKDIVAAEPDTEHAGDNDDDQQQIQEPMYPLGPLPGVTGLRRCQLNAARAAPPKAGNQENAQQDAKADVQAANRYPWASFGKKIDALACNPKHHKQTSAEPVQGDGAAVIGLDRRGCLLICHGLKSSQFLGRQAMGAKQCI